MSEQGVLEKPKEHAIRFPIDDNLPITVVKELTFEAAHFIPHHSKCGRVHGHSYRLQVGVTGRIDPDTGMVLDFSELKHLLENKIIRYLGHQFLNELGIVSVAPHILTSPYEKPTAELMVLWMAKVIQDMIPHKTYLSFVRLYETTTSYVEWRV